MLAPLYLATPIDQPNPLGESVLSLSPGASPGGHDLGPVSLFSQSVTLTSTLLTWQLQSVSEGHTTRSLALGITLGAAPKAGDSFQIGGGGSAQVFAQWGEEGLPALSATRGTVRFDDVSGRTLRITLTDLGFSDGTSDVLAVGGTLHTRGAMLD
jgi:hypothetical protein